MNSFSKIRSFSEIGWDDFQNNILKAIDKEINNCNDDYILNVCEEKYRHSCKYPWLIFVV